MLKGKHFFSALIPLLISGGLFAQQTISDTTFVKSLAPALENVQLYKNSRPPRPRSIEGSVMLQGFHWYADSYWYNPPNGWWGILNSFSQDIAASGFDMVWFPPAAVGSYYPREWYNLDSQWGKGTELVKAIRAMHSNGVRVIADIVLNHRNGSTGWADFKNPDWPTTVIVKNDEWQGSPKSENYDEGEGDPGCRDLDHKSPIVQNDTKKYLNWLKNNLGYDGWRYDMVKGYPAKYVAMYNEASQPTFSVGEYFDGNRDLVANWVNNSGTNGNASRAFDFPLKFKLIDALETNNFSLLEDNGRPAGLMGIMPSKAVTFVENHDTTPRQQYFIYDAPTQYRNVRRAAYAYILTHPGLPCVFWPHFYDWGPDNKKELANLIRIRKTAGIYSTSAIRIKAARSGFYAAEIDGMNQTVLLVLAGYGFNPGQGWTKAAQGAMYTVWLKNSSKY